SVRALPACGADKVDFTRDIRPILSDACFQCHGPDENQRKAKLRLDTKDGAHFPLRGGGALFVPGKPNESELLRRILDPHPKTPMPPAKSGKKLTERQIDLIRQWIEQGAAWSEHWAFVPPKRPSLPAVKTPGWVRTPIDAFILARLE